MAVAHVRNLSSCCRSELVVIEAIVKDSELVSVQLPQVEALKGRLKLAKEWLVKVKEQEVIQFDSVLRNATFELRNQYFIFSK